MLVSVRLRAPCAVMLWTISAVGLPVSALLSVTTPDAGSMATTVVLGGMPVPVTTEPTFRWLSTAVS